MREKDAMQPGGKITRRKFIQTTLIAGAVVSTPWFWASGSSWATGTPEADALAAFGQAVQAFNHKRPDALSPLLASNVELRKVHANHAQPVINGRQNVINYLRGSWNGSPPVTRVFDPYAGGQQPHVKIQGPNNTVAIVTGLACWKDDDGPNADGELRYKFQLQNIGGAWLITSLYGTYTATPPKPCP